MFKYEIIVNIDALKHLRQIEMEVINVLYRIKMKDAKWYQFNKRRDIKRWREKEYQNINV